MKYHYATFGRIEIDGRLYNKDVVVDRGNIMKREKNKSKVYKAHFGHTPLTPSENIPWNCAELVIGTGFYSRLPVTDDMKAEAKKRGIKLKIMKTAEACDYLASVGTGTNAVLHITCCKTIIKFTFIITFF